MQPTFTSSRILLPVRPWFITLTLVLALLLNLMPTAHWPGMPDWIALGLAPAQDKSGRDARPGAALCSE